VGQRWIKRHTRRREWGRKDQPLGQGLARERVAGQAWEQALVALALGKVEVMVRAGTREELEAAQGRAQVAPVKEVLEQDWASPKAE
jgi:hypothetical protein